MDFKKFGQRIYIVVEDHHVHSDTVTLSRTLNIYSILSYLLLVALCPIHHDCLLRLHGQYILTVRT